MYSIVKSKLEKNLILLEQAERDLEQNRKELLIQEQLQVDLSKVQLFFQASAEKVQKTITAKMESVVQSALNICFPGEFVFNFSFNPSKGKTEPKISLIQNGQETAPMASNGGSLIDIISFGLRLAVWSLSGSDNVIMMDEPFKFLDDKRQGMIARLLKGLSEQLNVQLIIITHRDEIKAAADKLFIIEKGE